MIRGIHHLAIATHDLDRIRDFYVGLFGCEVISDWGWRVGTDVADAITALHDCSAHSVMLRKGNAYIELFEYHRPQPGPGDPARRVCDPGLTHLCFDVTDLDGEYARLVDAGMTFHCPPQEVAPSVRTTYGRDPDGNVVELQEVRDETHRIAVPWLPGRGVTGA